MKRVYMAWIVVLLSAAPALGRWQAVTMQQTPIP
jgi:hypothetical protein